MTSHKPCVLCGRTGMKLTKEHAIPRWVSKLINTRYYGGLTHTAYNEQGQLPVLYRSPEFDLQVRQVCAPCNHGWLNDLERRFRSVMGPSLLGAPPSRPFDRHQQKTIAMWALKTYLLAEYTSGSRPHGHRRMAVPIDLLQHLRTQNRPHVPASVWIGAYPRPMRGSP